MKHLLVATAAVLALLLCPHPLAHAAMPAFSITDLGPISISGINDGGQMVGGHFLYDHGTVTNLMTLPGVSIDPSSGWMNATGINDAGQITGDYATVIGDVYPRAFLYSHGTFTDLGAISTYESHAAAMNAEGDVAMTWYGDMLGPCSAVEYSRGQHIFIPALGTVNGVRPDFSCTSANDINDLNQIVGQSGIFSASGHAFLYSNGQTFDLGTLPGGSTSVANGINDGGQIVGSSETASGQNDAFLYTGGTMHDLGSLGGVRGQLVAINAAGEVIGNIQVDSQGHTHAFLYWDGKMTDLNTLVPAGFSTALTAAKCMNDRGEIVAIGQGPSGDLHSYLLTPASAEMSPPLIAPTVQGTPGNNGWYRSPVTVSWNVSAPESSIASSSGCGARSLTTDTAGTTVTCSATSAAGLTTLKAVIVRVDQTPPTVTFSGNARTYTVEQRVSITCSASDALSGVASSTCKNVSAPAYTFPLGATALTAAAIDQAGNTGSGSTSFTVSVTFDSLCALTQQFSANPTIATTLCRILTQAQQDARAGNQGGKSVTIGLYESVVLWRTRSSFTPDQAAILIRLAASL